MGLGRIRRLVAQDPVVHLKLADPAAVVLDEATAHG